MAFSLLALKVFSDDFSDRALEKQGRFLELGVKLAVGEDISVNVVLGIGAEDFIFPHDPGVHFTDEFEIFI